MWNYSKKVIDHFLHPRNDGEIENADGKGEVGSLACGDLLKLTFKLDKNGRIADAKFKTFGCASAIASSSALTEMIKGKTLDEVLKITNKDIADFLGGLPEEKMHCSVMGREALEAAIENFKGAKESKHELHGKVVCNCFGVTDEEIRRVVTENNLSDVESVTNYTKAGGGCGLCQDEIRAILSDIDKKREVAKREQSGFTNIGRIHAVEKLVDEVIRPALAQDGGDIDLVDIDNNTVYVKLKGACAHCPSSENTLRNFVEKEMQKAISRNIVVKEVTK
jgi:NifU-like protein